MTSSASSNVFFTGTVHQAIAFSVVQRLPLVCFVTDGGEEASLWENEYLTHPEVFKLLHVGVVLLRLDAESREAALLAEVCPVHEIPHLLIISDGTILVKLVSGVSRDEFVSNVTNTLTKLPVPSANTQQPSSSPPNTSLSSPPDGTSNVQPLLNPAHLHSESNMLSSSPRLAATPYAEHTMQLPQRATVARAAPTVASASGGGSGDSTNNITGGLQEQEAREGLRVTRSQSYVEQQHQKQIAEQAERQRILGLLENDKEERRARDRERIGDITQRTSTPAMYHDRPVEHQAVTGNAIALSFRLVDGTNIKSRFPPSAVLGVDVRRWIEENRTDGDRPYNFMEILGPSRNRSLDITDENSALSSLFKRSATLILVPTATVPSVAYETATSGSTIHAVISTAYRIVAGAFGAVWSVGSYVSAPLRSETEATPSTDRGPPRRGGIRLSATTPVIPASPATPANPATTTDSSRCDNVRTLHDRRDDRTEDRRYYNGNQLSFEPKPKDT